MDYIVHFADGHFQRGTGKALSIQQIYTAFINNTNIKKLVKCNKKGTQYIRTIADSNKVMVCENARCLKEVNLTEEQSKITRKIRKNIFGF